MLEYALIVVILVTLFGLTYRKKPVIVSHWHKLIPALKVSVEDYYEALDAVIEERKVPNVKVWVTHYHEGGIASAKRMYLRISRREYIFDICAAPFGKDFFVSWWLGQRMKPPLVSLFNPETFYRTDTALMFQDSVHSAVMEVLDERMKNQGLRIMSEGERKPIMRELFKQRR